MSSLSFLVTELQSLASETRRRFPEVREAADKVIAALRDSQERVQEQLLQDGPPCEIILRPLLLGLGTKNSKVIGIALGSLQRLVTMKRIAPSATPAIVNASKDCVNQGVDIQLRILQMLLSLAMNSPDLHGEQLSEILYIYFKLQESRIAVVSSTAAATLRQLVMFLIGDRVTIEDDAPKEDVLPVTEITLPNGVKRALKPAAWDAYLLFENLCLLINSERARFLRLESLSKTFALELIESILTNCHQVIRKHPEQLILLGQHLCPFLVKSLTERPAFSSTLRSIRVLFLLLKQFSDELVAETEMFLTMLFKMISGDSEDDSTRPYWFRVIALEIVRGLCKDAEFMRKVHERYDAQSSRSPLFGSLVNTLNRVISEKPALLGVSTKIFGVGVGESAAGSALDVGHIVASAASVTAGMVGMTGQEVGLSASLSGMKVQCIDQLDKVDAPAIPDTYVFLLALQSFISLVDGFAALVLPLHHTLMVENRRNPSNKLIRAPPAFDLSKLPEEVQLLRVNSMIESTWHGFLAALSFIISTRLSDELFSDILMTYQALVNVSGALGLVTTRDALLTGLSKFAIPPAVVTALESYAEPATPRPSGVGAIADNLGLSGGTNTPPGLSDRNLACLKALLDSSLYLAGSLGSSWFSVLETLQNAELILASKTNLSATKRTSTHGAPSLSQSSSPVSRSLPAVPESPGSNVLLDLDTGSMQMHIQRLFEATKSLEDDAFQDFISALCKLSREMVQMQVTSGLASRSTSASDLLSPATTERHRRRASGIHIPKATHAGDFGISKLKIVCSLNVVRLVYRSPEIAWTPFTEHLLGIVLSRIAPSAIRVQAARCLDDVIVQVPKNVTSGAAKELQFDVQNRVFDVLKRQNEVDTFDAVASAEIEIRRLCLETLHLILQGSLFTLITGWDKIFAILSSVCVQQTPTALTDSESGNSKLSPKPRPPPLQSLSARGGIALIRIAFQSVTLICDALTQLDASQLQSCIKTLGLFGMQGDTNIALTAAASLLWNVSDVIQSRRKDAKDVQRFDELWMSFLKELLGLCPDHRPEVRDGSVQTLFRSLQLYGQSLSPDLWARCFDEIIFPLLTTLTSSLKSSTEGREAWDSSKALGFMSLGNILKEYMVPKLYPLDAFETYWKTIIGEVELATIEDNSAVVTASLKVLSTALLAAHHGGDSPKTEVLLEGTWQFVLRIGDHLKDRAAPTKQPHSPYSQDSLVAMIEVIVGLRSAKGKEWGTEKLARLLAILKDVMNYSASPEYRPDVDNTTPLQAVIMSVMKSIDIFQMTTARIVIADVAEYLTMAFIASFDHGSESIPSADAPPRLSKRKLTYIAVSKESMPLLVDLISRSVSQRDLYDGGTIEKAFGAFGIPMKLKYDCPPSSKLNKDPPLWKTATTCFLGVLKLFLSSLPSLRESLSQDIQASIWHQIAETFSGALLADCSAVETWSWEDRDAEELFDQALLQTLLQDVLPHLGHETVPDHVLAQFVKVLQQASQVCAPPREDGDTEHLQLGTTQEYPLATREHFAYSCFDLLFDMCVSRTHGSDQKDVNETDPREFESRRISTFALLPLITRCRAVLSSFVADEELRKGIPFSRAREEEILYVLRRMLSLRIWPGCLWATYSSEPSKHSRNIPPPSTDTTAPPTSHLSDAMKRGPRAHLFQLYPLLCKVVSIKNEGPVAWILVSSSSSPLVGMPLPTPAPSPTRQTSGSLAQIQSQSPSHTRVGSGGVKEGQQVIKLDAKELAAKCLEELGKEMGLIHG